jgi:peptide/nickel transport system permease protein
MAARDSGRPPLTRYIVRRVAFALFLVVAVSSASLVLARLAPGDFVSESLGTHASREALERERARYGLNKSIAAQYRDWLGRAVRFDFGESMQYGRPVGDLIPERAANTAILALAALILATGVGLPLGAFTGSRRDGILSNVIRAASLVLLSMPPLLTSLFLVFVAARTGWFPIGGMRSANVAAAGSTLDLLHHLVLPATAIGLPLAAMLERLQAQAMSEVIGRPFVLATIARGVPYSRVVWRDALKAALGPVASVYGLIVGTLLSGSFAVEVITSWPGLGTLMLGALRTRDVYLVAGCAGAGAVFLAFGTLVSDLALNFVDPRATEPDVDETRRGVVA